MMHVSNVVTIFYVHVHTAMTGIAVLPFNKVRSC